MSANALLQNQPLPPPWNEVVEQGWLDLFTIPCWYCTTKYLAENPEAVLDPKAPIWPRFKALPVDDRDLGVFGCDHYGGEDCGGHHVCFSSRSAVEQVIAAWNREQLGPLLAHSILLEAVLSTWSTMPRHLLREAQEISADMNGIQRMTDSYLWVAQAWAWVRSVLPPPTQPSQPSAETEQQP